MSAEKSLGEKRVRTSFNVGNCNVVDQIKQRSAELINMVESQRTMNNINITGWEDGDTKEFNRLLSLAQTAYEEAAMWAVKAVTIEGSNKTHCGDKSSSICESIPQVNS